MRQYILSARWTYLGKLLKGSPSSPSVSVMYEFLYSPNIHSKGKGYPTTIYTCIRQELKLAGYTFATVSHLASLQKLARRPKEWKELKVTILEAIKRLYKYKESQRYLKRKYTGDIEADCSPKKIQRRIKLSLWQVLHPKQPSVDPTQAALPETVESPSVDLNYIPIRQIAGTKRSNNQMCKSSDKSSSTKRRKVKCETEDIHLVSERTIRKVHHSMCIDAAFEGRTG